MLQVMRGELGHVGRALLSGPGLVNLYRGLVKSDGREPEAFEPRTSRSGRWRGMPGLSPYPEPLLRADGALCRQPGPQHGHLRRRLIAGGIVPRFQGVLYRLRFPGGVRGQRGASSPTSRTSPCSSSPTKVRACSVRAPICASPSGSVSDRLGKRFHRGSALIQWPWRRVGSRTQEDRVSQGIGSCLHPLGANCHPTSLNCFTGPRGRFFMPVVSARAGVRGEARRFLMGCSLSAPLHSARHRPAAQGKGGRR